MELCGEWTAYHDRMPGKPPTLRVDGCCCFPTGGWQAELRDRQQGFNPRIRMLDLVVTPPQGPAPDVLTELSVHWEDQTDSEYDQVHMLVTGDDAEGKLVQVEIIT